jgi:O-antigen ligase
MQTLAAASPPLQFGSLWAPVAAVALPALLAYNLPPSSTMLNQCLAVGLWGAWMAVAPRDGTPPPMRPGLPGAMLLALAAALAASGLWAGLPATILGPLMALVLFSIALASFGASQARRPDGSAVFACFAIGLAVTAVVSSGVAIVQAFAPGWTDGDLIARSGLPGRAVGNLRQPNHLCSLLLWGVIAVVALLQMGRLSLRWSAALVALMVFAVELSASRTGALGLGLLMLWGALDRRLSRGARLLLVLTPVLYAVSYGAMALYGQFTDQAFGAAARLASGDGAGGGDSPNSRRYIWANALALIAQQPWTGVGFGEFNIAWSLTAFPGRPTAFFDHTHNLPLQLIVELGLPLGVLLLGLLAWALFRAWKRSGQAAGDAGTAARAAFMLILMIGLHSLFEYPLWYAYFLLPAAFAWGFALGSGGVRTDDPQPAGAPAWLAQGTRLVGMLMLIGAVYAVADYWRIASIYSPGANAAPLNDRIGAGQRSLLFGHHADYAAATSPDRLPGRDLAFQRATHHLLDTRLMQSWAEYLAEQGQIDQARWLAQRLREFRNPSSDDFFAVCDAPASAAGADLRPFQCKPPERPHAWREFVRR